MTSTRGGSATARRVAERIDGDKGAGARISTHLDRRAALDGCDFAINMVQVGMHEATVKDFDVPDAHGLTQTIGDTLGVGGIFRALRTIPVMLGIGEDLAAVAPDAWFLNYTNPMAILIQAYAEGSPHKQVVGLCHSVQNTTRRSPSWRASRSRTSASPARASTTRPSSCASSATGEDLYPLLDAAIAKDPELGRRVRVEMYKSSATSRPSPPSTPPSTSRGSCTTRPRSSASASSRASTSAARSRTSRSTTTSAPRWTPAPRCPTSAATSTRPRSSTRWSPASSARSTATSATTG